MRCIYHGWKVDVSGRVVECPTQTVRAEQFAASVAVVHYPVHEAGGLAWVWLGRRRGARLPRTSRSPTRTSTATGCISQVPCNWLQGLEGTIDSAHAGMLHQTWIAEAVKMAEHSNLSFALTQLAHLRDRGHLVRLAGRGPAQDVDRSDVRAHHRAPACRW